jgi:hypothetical protein
MSRVGEGMPVPPPCSLGDGLGQALFGEAGELGIYAVVARLSGAAAERPFESLGEFVTALGLLCQQAEQGMAQ